MAKKTPARDGVITTVDEPTPIVLSGSNPATAQVPGSPSDPLWVRSIDRVLSIQRPLVLAHIRLLRRSHPAATPAQLIHILERRYLLAITSGGAAVGATAMVPVIGTGVTLTLSGVETAGFLEATALFAQSVAEVHGVAIADPVRARALVMTMIMGRAGSDLLKSFAGEVTGGEPARRNHWGQLVTSAIPQGLMGPVSDQIKSHFLKKFAVTQGTSLLGKAVPFGVGAAIGGIGNNMAGRTVIKSAREAFGEPQAFMPLELSIGTEKPTMRGRMSQLGARVTRRRSVEAPAPGDTTTP